MNYDPTEPVELINIDDYIVTIEQQPDGTVKATEKDDFENIVFEKVYFVKNFDQVIDRWYAKGYIFL